MFHLYSSSSSFPLPFAYKPKDKDYLNARWFAGWGGEGREGKGRYHWQSFQGRLRRKIPLNKQKFIVFCQTVVHGCHSYLLLYKEAPLSFLHPTRAGKVFMHIMYMSCQWQERYIFTAGLNFSTLTQARVQNELYCKQDSANSKMSREQISTALDRSLRHLAHPPCIS